MEVERETEASSATGNLVAALEQATLMAKQLPTTTHPSQLLQILAAFNYAHHHLSLILSNHHALPPSPPPSHLPQPTIFSTHPPENSVSSAVDGGAVDENDDTAGGDPMVMGDGDDEHNSRTTAAVDKVASRMRDCFIQNKRQKRMLSPSAELRRRYEDEAERGGATAEIVEFDYSIGHHKSRSLDLIYQFHA
ncbi:hypothetical protein ACS0TY_019938 [Phlomoides rotata]